MGLLDILERRGRLETPRVPLSGTNILESLELGSTTPSGVSINHEKALGLTAFWAGVRLISQTVASLPVEVFERVGKGSQLAITHPTYKVLYYRPNPYMTPFTFKEIRTAHLLTWGNSYAEIERSADGKPVNLWPLLPDRTGAEIKNGKKVYWTFVDGERVWLAADRVLHVPGLGYNGIEGYNVVKIQRDSVGLSIAANEYGSRFFGNSARPSGFLSHPGKPDKNERIQVRDEWNQMHSGLTQAQRTAVLWGGMKWESISLPPEEAQFLQTREMQIEEIARILNINPILLQHYTKATTWGSGIAEFLVSFAKFTITPWLEREEDVLNYDLFTAEEHETFYTKYNINALLRGDAKSQAEVLEIERRNGIISGDEWRALKEENPLPDGQGKAYLVPLNMMPLSQMLERPTEPASTPRSQRQTRSAVMRQRLRDAHIAAFQDGAARYVRRDAEALKKAVKQAFGSTEPLAVLNRWVEEFYPGQQQYIQRTMLPVVSTLATVIAAEAAEEIGSEPVEIDSFAERYTEVLAMREAGASRGQVLALLQDESEDTLQEALIERSQEWQEKRPGKVAMNEVVRVSSGAARFAWAAAGVAYLVWRANPDACPLCQELNGKKIGIAEYFLSPGESVSPEDRPGGLVADFSLAGPPLHQGCQCDIAPEF